MRAQFAMGSLAIQLEEPRTATVTRGGGLISRFSLPDPNDHVHSRTLLGGDRAALGGDESVYIFDVNTGQLNRHLADKSELVWAMAPSPDSRYLLSGGGGSNHADLEARHQRAAALAVRGRRRMDRLDAARLLRGFAGRRKPDGLALQQRRSNRMASFYPAARFHNSLYRPDIIRRLIECGSLRDAHAQADVAAARMTRPIDHSVRPAAGRASRCQPAEQPDAGSTVEVQATATPSGDDPVTSLQLLVDGRPNGPRLAVDAGEAAKPVAQQHSWKVDLPPGDHRLSVRADTDKSYGLGEAAATIPHSAQQPAETPRADTNLAAGKARNPQSPDPRRGNLYVLAIGISAYQDPSLRLPLAAADARAIADVHCNEARPAAVREGRRPKC